MFEKTCFFLILFLFHPCIPLYYCQCVFWVLGNKYTAAGNRKYDGCTFSFNVYNNIPLKRDHPSRLKLGNLKYFVEGDVRFRSETLWKILFFSPSSFSIIIFFHATINPLHMLPEKPQKKSLGNFYSIHLSRWLMVLSNICLILADRVFCLGWRELSRWFSFFCCFSIAISLVFFVAFLK